MVNPCAYCPAPCCSEHLITVTSFDVAEISGKTGKKPEEFATLASMPVLFLDNETVLECYKRKAREEFVLALKSRPCIFLKEGRCSIHDFAPLTCKLYPHSLRGRMAKHALCPDIPKLLFRFRKSDADLEIYRERLARYRKIVAKWNRMHGKKEGCLAFILEESKG